MKCTVIDDEPFALDLIRDYIRRTPFLELEQCFHNPFKAMAYLNKEGVDLIFLDINMPELSGIQLFKSLLNPPLVIFTTAYPEFAAESYEYNAVDYLLKPINYDRFLKAVNKAAALLKPSSGIVAEEKHSQKERQENHLFIKSGSQQVRVHPDDILYIEAAGNYMCFYTSEKKVMSLLSMKDALDLLPACRFARIHKSYIIALKHIEAIDRHEVVIADKKIPIGITFREQFSKLMKGNI